MVIDFANIVQSNIFDMGIVIAAVVARANGEIVYISDNWSCDPADVAQCIRAWQSKGQFVKFQDVKYSCLMNQPEYFSGINYKEKAFLIGAASPDANDQYYVLGYAPPGSNGTNGYVDVTRAANKMKEGGTYMDTSAELGKYDPSEIAGGGAAAAPAPVSSVDPALKQEVEGFVQWIKDPNGLAGYIQYYLDQNDPTIIAKMSKAYSDFRQVFGF